MRCRRRSRCLCEGGQRRRRVGSQHLVQCADGSVQAQPRAARSTTSGIRSRRTTSPSRSTRARVVWSRSLTRSSQESRARPRCSRSSTTSTPTTRPRPTCRRSSTRSMPTPGVDVEARFDEIGRRVGVVFGEFVAQRDGMLAALQTAWAALPDGSSEGGHDDGTEGRDRGHLRCATGCGRRSAVHLDQDPRRLCLRRLHRSSRRRARGDAGRMGRPERRRRPRRK